MKLRDLRPCDNCGGEIVPVFQIIRVSMAMFKPASLQTNMGLLMMMGGSLPLADVFSPDPEVVAVAGDEDRQLMTEVVLCMDCFALGKYNLAELVEKVNEKRAHETSTNN